MDFSQPLRVVTPTLDGDVLMALARADAWFTPGRLHRVLGRRSEDGVRRVLMRLAEEGIVSTLNGGNATLYRLNRRHLAAQPITELANLRSELVRRMSGAVRGWGMKPVYVALFGSVASGAADLGSDIDIFVVQPDEIASPEKWDEQVAQLESDVAAWTGNDARVVQMTEAHVRAHAGAELLLIDVVDHGILLIGDAEWLRRQLHLANRG